MRWYGKARQIRSAFCPLSREFWDSGSYYKTGWDCDVWFSTVCIDDFKNFKGWYPRNGVIREYVNLCRKYFSLVRYCNGTITPPDIPWGDVEKYPDIDTGQQDNTTCSNTGTFGGEGTPLKDIKLFLYANKVTAGTVKLNKPQLEVGTIATDWRPNPTDLAQANTESLTKKLEELTKKIEALEPKEVRKGGRKSGKKRD